jgi:hypothetical protein
MAYKSNWKSDKISIEEAIDALSREASDYTNNRYIVKETADDGGRHLTVYAERDEDGNNPYHKQIVTNFMGWRCVWFIVPRDYIDFMMELEQ